MKQTYTNVSNIIFATFFIILLFLQENTSTPINDKLSLEPLEIPVILSAYEYILAARANVQNKAFICGKTPFIVKPEQGFLFRSRPQPKLNCFVQFYIEPSSCSSWTHNFRNPFQNNVFRGFPDSMFDPLYDFSLEGKALQSKLKTNFVYVQSISLADRQKTKNYEETILYLIEYSWGTWLKYVNETTPISNFVPPNIFTIHTLYDKQKASYTVAESHLHTCSNAKISYKTGIKTCGNKLTENSFTCHQNFIKQNNPIERQKVYFDLTFPISWKKFERLKISYCSSSLIFPTTSNAYPYSTRENFSLRRWKASENLDVMFLTLLCPNCTILLQEAFSLARTYGATMVMSVKFPGQSFFAYSTPLDDLHFVNCFPMKKRDFISFLGYVMAFDSITWLILLFAILLSIPVYTLKLGFCNAKVGSKWFFSFYVLSAILLRQSYPDNKRARLLLIWWLLAAFILTFSYETNNVEKITVPFRERGVDTFAEMFQENFTIYSPHPKEIMMRSQYQVLKEFDLRDRMEPISVSCNHPQ